MTRLERRSATGIKEILENRISDYRPMLADLPLGNPNVDTI